MQSEELTKSKNKRMGHLLWEDLFCLGSTDSTHMSFPWSQKMMSPSHKSYIRSEELASHQLFPLSYPGGQRTNYCWLNCSILLKETVFNIKCKAFFWPDLVDPLKHSTDLKYLSESKQKALPQTLLKWHLHLSLFFFRVFFPRLDDCNSVV